MCRQQEFSDFLQRSEFGTGEVLLRNVLVALNVKSLKITEICTCTWIHEHVCETSFLQPEPIKKAETLAVQMCLSLSPT